MAIKTDKLPEPISSPLAALASPPPNIDEHNADMARRAAELAKARPLMLDCLDPTQAKYYEDRKPLYEWRIEVPIFRRAVGAAPAYMQKFDETVVAQSDGDAWAMFCDKIREWPGRRDAGPKITRMKRRTLRNAQEHDLDQEGDEQ